jgi:hypothetical protein
MEVVSRCTTHLRRRICLLETPRTRSLFGLSQMWCPVTVDLSGGEIMVRRAELTPCAYMKTQAASATIGGAPILTALALSVQFRQVLGTT